jgi:hypothetical protein
MGVKDAAQRVKFVTVNDRSSVKLCNKVLNNAPLIAELKEELKNKNAGLICVQSGDEEHALADALGIEFLSNHPQHEIWGTKFGSRELFKEANIPYAKGTPLVFTPRELAAEICRIYYDDTTCCKFMVKLNESFNGEGNAILDLSCVVDVNIETVIDSLSKMKWSKVDGTWGIYCAGIMNVGVIAEQFIADELCTPSFIGYISADGEVHRMGTQQQVLEGLEYMGCIFPADESFRLHIQEYGFRVGAALASKGARGNFGIDFIVSKNPPIATTTTHSELGIYAVEINLRHTGSTYPFMLAKLLTEARLDPSTGELISSAGMQKFYRASSYVKHEDYKKLTPEKVIKIVREHKLLFDITSHTGVVFPMLGAITEFGKFGMTCIANSQEEADAMTATVKTLLAQSITNGHVINTQATIGTDDVGNTQITTISDDVGHTQVAVISTDDASNVQVTMFSTDDAGDVQVTMISTDDVSSVRTTTTISTDDVSTMQVTMISTDDVTNMQVTVLSTDDVSNTQLSMISSDDLSEMQTATENSDDDVGVVNILDTLDAAIDMVVAM